MSMDWERILTTHPIFSALDEKEIDYLIEVSDEKEYEKDDVIIREGEQGNSVYVIGFGAVDVVLPWRGERTLLLTTLGKGEFFGEVALFEKPARRSATVIAAERCVLLEIDGGEFLSVAKKHPEIVMDVIEKVTSRLRNIGDQVLKVKLRDMDEKIETLNARLDAELRATSVTLNATQTIFDQTSRRANEIIESAERSRGRLTTTASILGTGITVLVAVFGYMGISEIGKVTRIKDRMQIEAQEIAKIQSQLKEDIATMNPQVEQIEAMASDVTKVTERLANVDEQLTRYYKKIVLPQFRDELTKDIDNAEKMYRAMLQLQDDDVTNGMFRIINGVLFEIALDTETDDEDKADTGEKGNAITDMLETDIGGYEKTSRQELLAYFAILWSYTINDEQERFDETLRNFEEYAKRHRDPRIRGGLGFDLTDYVDLISDVIVDQEDAKRKTQQLTRVWRQIP
jgi:CRP-like cAMP-binding protein